MKNVTKSDMILNPKTNRYILVNGPTYQKLIKEGYYLNNKSRIYKKRPSRQYKDVLDTNIENIQQMKVAYNVRDRKGRGIMTKGWGKVAPKRGKERNELYKQCGKKCFLKADTLSFPICPLSKCEIDCRGVQAAYIRASQWKYNTIREGIQHIKKTKCK